MSKEIEIGMEKSDELCKIAKALASEIRLEIIKLLNYNSYNVNEISGKLGIPASTTGINVKVLEEANIIHTELQPGTRGSMKVCSLKRGVIKFIINSSVYSHDNTSIIDMPIGNYVDCKVEPTCGLVNDKYYINGEDEPRSFYSTERTSAQLIWFHKGYLEYRFSNFDIQEKKATLIEVSLELCSEAPNYRNDWPSDITMWVNGHECGTWTSLGDFGGRRGKNNPTWWSDGSTQFGRLKTWGITKEGVFIDGKKAADIKIAELLLSHGDYISVRIGIKDNAKHVGGINIFGEKFGDHSQNITMRLDY